jgi:Tfp pilus assembly protein PilF
LAWIRRGPLWIAAGVVAAALAVYLVRTLTPGVPQPGSDAYERATRAFYHGLAALEVGLLDDARTQFGLVTGIAPAEPAAWANLALAQLRLGELDAAAGPIERALALAPQNAEIALLAGRMESSRGRLDEGVARLRRAVELETRGVRARMALAEEVERAGGANADAEALRLLDEVAGRMPANVAVLLERARLAAKIGDAARVKEAVTRLAEPAASWPALAQQQFAALRMAVESGGTQDTVRATVLLRNVLARVPAFIEGLTAVRTPPELVGEPFARFLAMPPASPMPSPRDASLAFTAEPVDGGAQPVDAAVAAWLAADGPPVVLAVDRAGTQALDGSGRRWPAAAAAPGTSANADARVLVLDWNRDFRPDLVTGVTGGLRLWLQGEDGRFAPAASARGDGVVLPCECTGAWAADIEMDGDLDVVAGVARQPPIVLRNNGDGTWREIRPFAGAAGARAFGWADLDQDADPDATFLDSSGRIAVFLNRQAGQFSPADPPAPPAMPVALAVADVNADGVFDAVVLDGAGGVSRYSYTNAVWNRETIVSWPAMAAAEPGRYRLLAADLDNNGGLDLVASGNGTSRIWLVDETRAWHEWPDALDGEVFSAADLDGDGRLDLVGAARGRPTRFSNRASAGYHWKVVRVRAQQTAGDQRVNSFGVGATVEVRAGLLLQRHVLTGAPVHVGLGVQTTVDVARIVWPNGVPQAEFGAGVDDTIVAEQRLKGSCPWVFAWDGRAVGFVTDFLWRSPLGLRINAQDTAGVAQTEDWVRIRGDQLAPKDGAYDVRITAELWESHFFDHVSLLVVDHPADVETFVDERFAPASPPALEVRAFASRQAVAAARDQAGRDVTTLVAAADGRTVASFDRGVYQGIAREHWLELELETPVPAHGLPTLLATGWIYPTDSSINVAMGQGSLEPARGIALEIEDGGGGWTTVAADLGFPAGKNKTMLIDLRKAAGATRLRLRTNLEVYWDALAVAARVEAPRRVTRLAASSAELR